MSKKKSNAGEISATVDESNEMRKKLGIRPLEEDSSHKKKVGTSDNPATAPHLQSGDGQPAEGDVKKRVAASRNKREHEELVSGQGLGDILSNEGSAADWIARTRQKDGSMKKATTGKEKDSQKSKDSKGKDAIPAGMKVRHDAEQIADGDTIMTLADSNILDDKGELNDQEDELANVNMLDSEKAKHNEAVRNQKEYDRDLDGQNILSKYDELKTGPKGFVLGGQVMGVIEETDPEKRLAILTHLSEKSSLESQPKLQADFYTTEEMNKFRKPKKKVKKRTRQADDKKDPLPVAPAGSAQAPPGRTQDAGSDEEDPELYEQLSKQRRLVRRSDAGAVRKGEAALAAVSDRIQVVEKEAEEKESEKEVVALQDAEKVSMTATTEFCNIVQTPLEKIETLKHESFRGSTLYKQQATQRKGVKAGSAGHKKGEGNHSLSDDIIVPQEVEISSETQLKENPLDLSCASGLAYLRARAQIGNDQETHKCKKSDNRPLEMSTVDGDIKLEYRDDYGRVQTPKEAFRAISWKFHGKTPGRKNMERRLLRLENEMKLKSMDPMSELPTLRALRHVQTAEAKPYMVLSGANEK
jgi:U4/U6.U5 tri-snRNP-associated protein 1